MNGGNGGAVTLDVDRYGNVNLDVRGTAQRGGAQ